MNNRNALTRYRKNKNRPPLRGGLHSAYISLRLADLESIDIDQDGQRIKG